MRKGIKKSVLVISILLSMYIILLLVNFFAIKNVNPLFAGITASVVFLPMFFIFGLEKQKRRFTPEVLFNTIFYTVLYIMITYIIGIFTGFNYSIYSMKFGNIIKNVLPHLFAILTCELLRAEVTRKCEHSIVPYALMTIALVIIDCTLYETTFKLSTGDGQIKFICNILLPSVSKNLFLMYISSIGGYYCTVLYRMITELKMYLIPIIPDFGLYFDSILGTLIPVIFGFINYLSLKEYQKKEIDGKTYRKSKLYTYASVIVTVLIIVVVVSLTSCRFTYGAIAIGSGSMTGVFSKGDVVVFKQLGKYEPQEKDIIVFVKDGKKIVHRIIEVVEVNEDETVYYTKGDANPTPDGYPVFKKDIMGVYKLHVKFIGLPSVSLNEIITRKK